MSDLTDLELTPEEWEGIAEAELLQGLHTPTVLGQGDQSAQLKAPIIATSELDDVWRTLGGSPGEKGDHEGGHPVMIDDATGTIKSGAQQGKNVSDYGKQWATAAKTKKLTDEWDVWKAHWKASGGGQKKELSAFADQLEAITEAAGMPAMRALVPTEQIQDLGSHLAAGPKAILDQTLLSSLAAFDASKEVWGSDPVQGMLTASADMGGKLMARGADSLSAMGKMAATELNAAAGATEMAAPEMLAGLASFAWPAVYGAASAGTVAGTWWAISGALAAGAGSAAAVSMAPVLGAAAALVPAAAAVAYGFKGGGGGGEHAPLNLGRWIFGSMEGRDKAGTELFADDSRMLAPFKALQSWGDSYMAERARLKGEAHQQLAAKFGVIGAQLALAIWEVTGSTQPPLLFGHAILAGRPKMMRLDDWNARLAASYHTHGISHGRRLAAAAAYGATS